jgi:hypothetical protein
MQTIAVQFRWVDRKPATAAAKAQWQLASLAALAI